MRQTIADTLVLRTVESEDDVRRVAAFNDVVMSDTDQPDPRIGQWVTNLLAPGIHPTLTWDDYYLVEDTASGEVVSSLCIIPQTWTFGGVPFKVGRIELVGTRKDYRRRGLIRAQFEAAHRRCAEQGLIAQGITGIQWYYRQFGYEYALDLDGGQVLSFESFPALPGNSPFTLREWQPADLPRLEALYDGFARGKLVVCPRPADHWLYRFHATGERSIMKRWLYAITRAEEVIGYVSIPVDTWGPRPRIDDLVLGESIAEVVPWLMPRLREEVTRLFAQNDPPLLPQLTLALGAHHPIYPYLRSYQHYTQRVYAWYIRVPDVAAFVREVAAPVLERRIAAGPLAGLTRSLTLNFHTGGLRLDFEGGLLAAAENLPRGLAEDAADVAFPPLVFTQLLFGYRSLAQLHRWFPDVWCKAAAWPVVEGLFPRRPSWLGGALE